MRKEKILLEIQVQEEFLVRGKINSVYFLEVRKPDYYSITPSALALITACVRLFTPTLL